MKLDKDTETFLVYTGLGLAALGLLWYFTRHKNDSRAQQIGSSAFRAALAAAAMDEYNKWDKGKIKEGDERTMERLREYWREGAGIYNWSDKRMVDEAWSAAFISYIMRLSGAGSDFKYSPSHSVYLRDAIKNRKENNQNPFKGYKPEEVEVQVGDLLGRPRQGGITYDTTGGYIGHSDVVVGIKDGFAQTIGGNVSQSVSQTLVPLTSEGKIDNSRVKGYPYHVVVKNTKQKT